MGAKAGAGVSVDRLESRLLLSGVLGADVNTLPSRSYFPFGLTKVGGTTYFSQHDGVHGAELWKTDGTDAGTVMVKDIFPGLGSGEPGGFVAAADGTVYFLAVDGKTGYELWKTDGTEAGTVLVKDINPGPAFSIPSNLTAFGNKVAFYADDGVHGAELWVSDGTAAGTWMVKDVAPGATGQTTKGLAAVDGKLYFYANTGTTFGLWKSGGAVGDATLLKDNVRAQQITPFDHRVYFTDAGGLVWTSDGTPAGTVVVQNVSSKVGQFVNTGGALFFNRTSGTGAGVYRIAPGSTTVTSTSTGLGLVGPTSLANVDGDLYFTDSTSSGARLYAVYSFDSLAYPVTTLAQGQSGARLESLVGVGDTLYFALYTPSAGYSLWWYPIWASTPEYVAPLTSLAGLYAPSSFTAAGSRVVFIIDDPTTGLELWSSDGTASGTRLIRDTYPGTAFSYPYFSRPVGDRIVFYADDGVHGSEPYALDASGSLTSLGDFEPGKGSSFAIGTTLIGDRLLMAATTTALGRELWVTDATPGGTKLLKDISPGATGSEPGGFVEFDGRVFFTATDVTHGSEVWVTDGTTAGTALFKDILPGTGSGGFGSPVVLNGRLYFVAADAAGGSELWRTDGTVAGTVRVKDIYPGTTGSAPASLTVFNGALYFTATDNTHGAELWRSDGTDAGTGLVKDVYAGGLGSSPAGLTVAGGYLFFSATDATGNTAWRTDGTDAGTMRLSTAALSPYGFTAMNGAAYFFATRAAKGLDLWRSDGTPTGTAMVAPLTPPPTTYTPLSPASLTLVNGRLFFLADNGETARELWSSDGTMAGTAVVQDLSPGTIQGVGSSQVAVLNGAVYVSGDDSISGFEPWRFADEYAPVVWSQSTDLRAAAPAFTVTFNEAITPPSAFDLALTNLTSGQAIPNENLQVDYDASNHVLRLSFVGYPQGAPPDGNYRLTIGGGAVTDLAGNPLAAPTTLDFFLLRGDANHDRTVDFNDLVKLAQNYNTSKKTFAEGDFNFDGVVDFNDLVLLAQRYNTTLPAPTTPVAAKAEKSLLKAPPAAQPKKPASTKKPIARSAFAVARIR